MFIPHFLLQCIVPLAGVGTAVAGMSVSGGVGIVEVRNVFMLSCAMTIDVLFSAPQGPHRNRPLHCQPWLSFWDQMLSTPSTLPCIASQPFLLLPRFLGFLLLLLLLGLQDLPLLLFLLCHLLPSLVTTWVFCRCAAFAAFASASSEIPPLHFSSLKCQQQRCCKLEAVFTV